MSDTPLSPYYDAVIASSEKNCGTTVNENPFQIIGSLGTKLAMILRQSRDEQTVGQLAAYIEVVCGAMVYTPSPIDHPANDPHNVAAAILEARK